MNLTSAYEFSYLVYWLQLPLFLILQVVLAANELPSINDITYPELIEIITKVIEKLQSMLILKLWLALTNKWQFTS